MAQEVFLSLGSNIGDREHHLRRSVELLRNDVDVVCVSSVWGTKPVGVTSQPDFLNCAISARTHLEAPLLLARVKAIEREIGRRETYRWGPRVIDIDIILYGELILDLPDLIVPHRELAHRAFVLAPLNEIAPDTVDPRSGLTVRELLAHAPGQTDVTRLGPLPIESTESGPF